MTKFNKLKANTMPFMMILLAKKKKKMNLNNKSRIRTKMNMLTIWKVSIMMKMQKCKKSLNKASCRISSSVHTSIKKLFSWWLKEIKMDFLIVKLILKAKKFLIITCNASSSLVNNSTQQKH